MLHFESLDILDQHLSFLQKKIKSQNAFFLVGGCVRDLLLGTETSPTDIDFTMAGNPDAIYKSIDKKGLSHFITEKFGTITLIQKNLKKSGKIGGAKTGISKIGKNTEKAEECDLANLSDLSDHFSDPSVIKYELTPLRTEGAYEDSRHPGEITRSNDILLDSMRRDFTVNCMYYFEGGKVERLKGGKVSESKDVSVINDEELVAKLNKYGYLYISNENLFILQSHEIIKKLFADGKFHKDELPYLMNQLTENHIVQTRKKGNGKLEIKNGKFILDPHKGLQDLIHRKLRAVGDPDKRFTEDALRMIRAIRFVSVMNTKLKSAKVEGLKGGKVSRSHAPTPACPVGRLPYSNVILFDFIKDTRVSIKKNSPLVANVAKERIKDELCKIALQGDLFVAVVLLDEAKLLPLLFPALAETKNVEQPVRYHPFDVYAHTLLALFELQKINKDYLARLAMLYHDVGKVDQFDAYEEGLSKEEIKEILAGPRNHRRSSAEYVKTDFAKLGFSKKEIDEIARLVAHHHKLEEILYALPEKSEKNMRKFLSEAGKEKVHTIIDITIADRLGQYNPLQNSSDISDVYALREVLERLHKKEGQFTMKDLAIDGAEIMKYFKLPAGPKIGELLEKSMNRVIDDIKERNKKDAIIGYLKAFAKKKG